MVSDLRTCPHLLHGSPDPTESEMEVKVYSNQKSVALYVNGEKAGEQTGEHVFSFRVPLTGEIEVKAVAGDCTDTASFRHVDTPRIPATSWSRPSPRVQTGSDL